MKKPTKKSTEAYIKKYCKHIKVSFNSYLNGWNQVKNRKENK